MVTACIAYVMLLSLSGHSFKQSTIIAMEENPDSKNLLEYDVAGTCGNCDNFWATSIVRLRLIFQEFYET
uniref:Putative secreted protein n=1 Tax=Anopheles marajoara TaxID=58244 RepID=A0A2M4CEJ9_9DIPT